MKKLILILTTFLFASCTSIEESKKIEQEKIKLEDANCKVEFANEMSEYTTSAYLLGYQNGWKKELDSFDKLRSNANRNLNIPCDSLRNEWDRLSKKVTEIKQK
jgi:hypothetical protein